MGVPAHWSARYFRDKLQAEWYARLHPRAPWYTRDGVAAVEARLRPEDTGIEWGAGRSTIWYAERTAGLISIEHDGAWYDRVRRELTSRGLDNAVLVRKDDSPDAYTAPGRELSDGMLDFAAVDGLHRDLCVVIAIAKLRSGGMLVLDDAHRYLPSASRAPLSLGPLGTPPSERWREAARLLADWACVWTSDGVRDTAIWTKP